VFICERCEKQGPYWVVKTWGDDRLCPECLALENPPEVPAAKKPPPEKGKTGK
jgi:hypothetical protein